jgi:TDG/mug DNA glycosylase family protein
MSTTPPLLTGLAPVICADTRILVLGSFPGAVSLAQQQYYAHPRNQLWELLGALIGIDLRAMPYDDRLAALRAHGIGLWDVIAEARRLGSLDADIQEATHNALADLVGTLPHLRVIGFNGATAARAGRKQLQGVAAALRLIDLPSSSPAHTIGFDPKWQIWRQLALPV